MGRSRCRFVPRPDALLGLGLGERRRQKDGDAWLRRMDDPPRFRSCRHGPRACDDRLGGARAVALRRWLRITAPRRSSHRPRRAAGTHGAARSRHERRRLERLDRGHRSDRFFCRGYCRRRGHVSRRRLDALDDRFGGRRCRSGAMRRRLRRGRWGRRHPRRQERKRIDVPLRVRGHAHAEMDVRPVRFRGPTRPNLPHLGALAHGVAFRHAERAKMDERHRVAVAGLDRHDLPVGPDRARERDDARGGGGDRRIALRRDVDPAMLTSGVRVTAKNERPQHFTRSRPCPGVCRRGQEKQGDCGGQDRAAHDDLLVVVTVNADTVAGRSDVVKIVNIRGSCDRGGCAECPSAVRRHRRPVCG